MAGVAAARKAAFTILQEVERGDGHSDDLLRDHKFMATMSAADRHLTTALVLGVLRWQIQLDQVVRRLLSKPNMKLDPAVLVALRLGAFQLIHLDRIPVHAAVNESVELIKRSGIRSAAGLVNAVLRKLARATHHETPNEELNEPAVVPRNAVPPDEQPAALKGTGFSPYIPPMQEEGALSPEGSSSSARAHPQWITQRWTKLFGCNAACAICDYDQTPPAPAVRLSAPEVERELADADVILSAGKLLTAARLAESGEIRETKPFREGRARMQDEGSQLVAEIAAAAASPKPEKILDCCAAPGGKTLILAERIPAAHIVACEASPPRLKLLRERLAGLGERIECRVADATALTFASEFDLVLADVPCSGTGTLSRNPEIRHRLQPDDLARQAERQRAILASALRAVRPGGHVVYSTCSLEPEENEEVIAAVLAENSNAHVLPLAPALGALRDRGILVDQSAEPLRRCVTREGFLRLLPGQFGTDGFFIGIIERDS